MSEFISVTPELLAGFLDEAPEYLQMLDDGLMAFESKAGDGALTLDDPEDQERMNTMFRAAHSLKGLAAAMGFDKIRELTHVMETLFDHVRMGKRPLNPASFETLFSVFDKLKALVEELSDPPDEPVTIEAEFEALNRILNESESTEDGSTNEKTPPEATPVQAEVAAMPSGEIHLDDPELVQLFIETTNEAVDILTEGLLVIEQTPDDREVLNEVFRAAHNIKGAAGAAGCDVLFHLTHDMETVLDRIREGTLAIDESLMNVLLKATDHLRAGVESLREHGHVSLAPDLAQGLFAAWIPSQDQPAAAVPSVGDFAAPPPTVGNESSGGGNGESGDLTVVIMFPPNFDEAPIQAMLINNKLESMASVVSTDPDLTGLDLAAELRTVRYVLRTDATAESVETSVKMFEVESVEVQASGTASTPGDQQANTASESQPPAAIDATRASTPPPAISQDETSAQGRVKEGEKSTPSPKATAAKPIAPSPPEPSNAGRASVAKRDASPPKSKTEPVKVGETLRVDLERLDQLMNLGGELAINKARFTQIHSNLKPVFRQENLSYLADEMAERITQLSTNLELLPPNRETRDLVSELGDVILHLSHDFDVVKSLLQSVHETRGLMNDFEEAIHNLTRVSDGIQQRIMETRMVPVGPLFGRFRRVIRDISKAQGKKIDLVLHGETTELDKRMIDELGDPLTHMVRNAVDHGIETPDVRTKAGKQATGILTLSAYHRGNNIYIEVSDDGRGIDVDAVKAKIVEQELATPTQVEQMSDKEAVQYVFRAGFSTAKQVSDLSGRGMGMDIVRSKLEALNGTVEVDSVRGQGSKVVISLPLTLAIISSLLARVGRGVYAIPLEAVREIITVRRSEIQSIHRRDVVRVRDSVIPVVLFEDVFNTSRPGLVTESRDADQQTLVILGLDDQKMGLVVDQMIGQEEVVIKSIAENYRNVTGISGASIMGDGTVSLILDVNAMMAMAADVGRNDTAPRNAAKNAPTVA